jgi:DNA-binding GntR family transcriptional regulator
MSLDQAFPGLSRQDAPVRHAETGSWAASMLRDRISAGQLAPGSKLSEEPLCEVLGVSRNTLREAFATLSREHVVTRIPNRGVFVTRPTVEDIREIYRVRHFLEPAALTWSMTPNTDALHEAIARARTARTAGSVPGMANANQDFHAAIVALTESDRLNLQMAQVLAEMRLVFHSMVADPLFHAPYIDDNAVILARFEAGDRTEAAARMADYLRRAEEQVIEARSLG